MTNVWQPVSRASCLNTRTIWQTCYKVESLAARLAQTQLRRISTSPPHISCLGPRRRGTDQFRKASRDLITSRIGIRTFASRHILTHYTELPPDFTPEEGLDFRADPLSAVEVRTIFGKTTDVKTANHLMKMLHGLRVAGTLEDPDVESNVNEYERRAVKTALVWLRKYVPVDEIKNAGLKAEDELRIMEVEILEDSERIGIYKPNSGKDWGGREKTSVIEKVKKAREKQQLKEDKAEAARKKSQADEIRQNTGTLQTYRPNPKVELAPWRTRDPSENEWFKEYAAKSNLLPDGPPDMTTLQRLWPSALMVLGTFTACYIFTQFYIPPKVTARLWPDMPPSAATIIGIIALNATILALWRIPPLFRLFNTYFLVVPASPNFLSILGNIFSHQTTLHFAGNMTILWLVGTRLHEEIGRANFLALYLCSGVFGSFCSLAFFVARGSFISTSLGASGAISGVISAYLMLDTSAKVQFFGFPPKDWPSISSVALLCIIMSLEVLGLRRFMKSGRAIVDNVAHLAGYTSGITYCELMKMRRRQRVKFEEERRKNLGWVDRIKEGTRPSVPPKGV